LSSSVYGEKYYLSERMHVRLVQNVSFAMEVHVTHSHTLHRDGASNAYTPHTSPHQCESSGGSMFHANIHDGARCMWEHLG
jgi:hypothetical protein